MIMLISGFNRVCSVRVSTNLYETEECYSRDFMYSAIDSVRVRGSQENSSTVCDVMSSAIVIIIIIMIIVN